MLAHDRKQGLARRLMLLLEEITEKVHDAFFVDLFVRVSNQVAIKMYEGFGYSVYRRVLGERRRRRWRASAGEASSNRCHACGVGWLCRLAVYALKPDIATPARLLFRG